MPNVTFPSLAIVVAMTRDRVIGNHGELPWHLPKELRLFRDLTMKGTLIMGHNTFRSIGRPLPGRTNIVLSKSLQPNKPGLKVARSFMEGLQIALRASRPIYFVGGYSVYQKALSIVDLLHISWIDGTYQGDLYFPDFDLDEWMPVQEIFGDGFRHLCYERRTLCGNG